MSRRTVRSLDHPMVKIDRVFGVAPACEERRLAGAVVVSVDVDAVDVEIAVGGGRPAPGIVDEDDVDRVLTRAEIAVIGEILPLAAAVRGGHGAWSPDLR